MKPRKNKARFSHSEPPYKAIKRTEPASYRFFPVGLFVRALSRLFKLIFIQFGCNHAINNTMDGRNNCFFRGVTSSFPIGLFSSDFYLSLTRRYAYRNKLRLIGSVFLSVRIKLIRFIGAQVANERKCVSPESIYHTVCRCFIGVIIQ